MATSFSSNALPRRLQPLRQLALRVHESRVRRKIAVVAAARLGARLKEGFLERERFFVEAGLKTLPRDAPCWKISAWATYTRNWEPSLVNGVVRGFYKRILNDPSMKPMSVSAFVALVKKVFPAP